MDSKFKEVNVSLEENRLLTASISGHTVTPQVALFAMKVTLQVMEYVQEALNISAQVISIRFTGLDIVATFHGPIKGLRL